MNQLKKYLSATLLAILMTIGGAAQAIDDVVLLSPGDYSGSYSVAGMTLNGGHVEALEVIYQITQTSANSYHYQYAMGYSHDSGLVYAGIDLSSNYVATAGNISNFFADQPAVPGIGQPETSSPGVLQLDSKNSTGNGLISFSFDTNTIPIWGNATIGVSWASGIYSGDGFYYNIYIPVPSLFTEVPAPEPTTIMLMLSMGAMAGAIKKRRLQS